MFSGSWTNFRSGSDMICNPERGEGGRIKKRVDHFEVTLNYLLTPAVSSL